MVHGSQNRGSWASWGPTIIFSEKKSSYLNNLSLDLIKMTINESQVNTDEDPGLKELFSVDTFPRVMLWSKRWGDGDFEKGHQTYNKAWGMNSTNIQQWLNNQLL